MNEVKVYSEDILDAVCFCYAGLAQDAEFGESHYLNIVLNLLYGYLSTDQRKEVEVYLAEKKYLSPLEIEIVK